MAAVAKGAEVIVDYLIKEKVPYLFGVCGHGIIGLLDVLHDAEDRIKTISVHHEQTAGYMADAYYRVRQEPVATYTSCGPGSCNLLIALGAAMMDSSAFLAITANVPTTQFNRLPFQELGQHFQADFPTMVRPVVKRSFQATRVDMLPLSMKQAFGLLNSGRPGPVNLDVAFNVFQETAEVEIPDPDPPLDQRSPGNPVALGQALEMLLSAERPIILAGQGVLIGKATEALQEFVDIVRVPVITSPGAKGAIDETHTLAYGPLLRSGTHAAYEAARQADVIIALGCSFDDRTTGTWINGSPFAFPPAKLVQIDNNPSEIGRNYPVNLGIVGDLQASLEFLLHKAHERPRVMRKAHEEWIARLNEYREVWNRYQARFEDSDEEPMRPERVIKSLSRVIPENAVITTDVGVHHNWILQLWQARRPRHLLQSWGFAAMGFASSGILGAKLARPDSPAVAVTGDGAFLMTPHVLATAVEYGIPAIWVIWNNKGYCSTRDQQLGIFGKEFATSFKKADTGELYNPNFAMLAHSFGVEALSVSKPGDFEAALDTAVKAEKPFLIDVTVNRDIRPVSTGTWSLPPLPHSEPNFIKLASAT